MRTASFLFIYTSLAFFFFLQWNFALVLRQNKYSAIH